LEVCERTFRRYLMRYQAEVLEGLVDRRLEQVSEHVKAKVNVAPVHRAVRFFVCEARGDFSTVTAAEGPFRP